MLCLILTAIGGFVLVVRGFNLWRSARENADIPGYPIARDRTLGVVCMAAGAIIILVTLLWFVGSLMLREHQSRRAEVEIRSPLR